MTGGTVLVLGKTGRNFAAGMSGGRAFVLDLVPTNVNPEMVDIMSVPADERDSLKELVSSFAKETQSAVAQSLLDDWDSSVTRISLVMPRDYARVLRAMEKALREGLPADQYVMEVANG